MMSYGFACMVDFCGNESFTKKNVAMVLFE